VAGSGTGVGSRVHVAPSPRPLVLKSYQFAAPFGPYEKIISPDGLVTRVDTGKSPPLPATILKLTGSAVSVKLTKFDETIGDPATNVDAR
jgi:hypothetical protein